MRVLFWDIDGTLLTTGRAGIFAWERAVADEFGCALDFSSVKTAGLTDTEIAAALCGVAAQCPSNEEIARVLRRYEEHLPGCLPLRTGTVLPGVSEVLEHLRGLDHVHSMLLTGNTRAGARAKLAHYGLAGYFERGAFADDCRDRVEVARRAAQLIAAPPGVRPAVFVIGDTPHDIRCGRVIQACTVAVATGEYSEAELASHGASVVLPRLPAAERFLRILDEATLNARQG